MAGTAGVAGAATKPIAWIANYGSNSVSVLDVNAGSVVDTIAVGAAPIGIAIHPTRPVLYVSNFDAGTVSVISRRTHAVLTTITAASGARGIAFTLDGTKAYVVNYYNQSFTVIDAINDTAKTTTNGLTYPVAAALLPNGSGVYVTQHSGSTKLGLIDTATDAISIPTSPTVGWNSMAIRFNASDSLGYVTGYSQSLFTEFNPSTGASRNSAESISYPYGVALAESKGLLYVTQRFSGTVKVLKINELNLGTSFDVGQAAGGICLTKTGQSLVVVLPDAHKVVLVDTATNTVGIPIAVGNTPLGEGEFISEEPLQ
jgi:YVTN family beta-propeller protein